METWRSIFQARIQQRTATNDVNRMPHTQLRMHFICCTPLRCTLMCLLGSFSRGIWPHVWHGTADSDVGVPLQAGETAPNTNISTGMSNLGRAGGVSLGRLLNWCCYIAECTIHSCCYLVNWICCTFLKPPPVLRQHPGSDLPPLCWRSVHSLWLNLSLWRLSSNTTDAMSICSLMVGFFPQLCFHNSRK
jgi:hypothetical protein